MQVNVLEAKNRLSQLIKSAQAGHQVIIANRGVPVAQLIPIQAASPSQDRNFLEWLANNPLPAHAQRSAPEIDAVTAEKRAAWD